MYPGSFVCRQGGGGVTNKHNSPERHGLVDLDSQLSWGLASRLGGLSDVSLSPTSCQPDLGRKPGEIQITVLVQSSFDRSHGGLGPFSPNNCREDICHSALFSGDSLHPWSPGGRGWLTSLSVSPSLLAVACGDWGYASQQLQEWSSAGSSVPRSWCLSDDNQSPAWPGSATKNSTRGANWEWAVQEDLWPGNAWEEPGRLLAEKGSHVLVGGGFLLKFYLQTLLEYSTMESGL